MHCVPSSSSQRMLSSSTGWPMFIIPDVAGLCPSCESCCCTAGSLQWHGRASIRAQESIHALAHLQTTCGALLSTGKNTCHNSLSGLIRMYIYPLYKTRWHKKHCTMRYHITFIFSSVNWTANKWLINQHEMRTYHHPGFRNIIC